MAVVGTAEIIVRAITKDVAKDIRSGFKEVEAEARRAGANAGRNFSRSMNVNIDPDSGMGRLIIRLKEISPNAQAAADAFTRLIRKGYYVQSGLGAIAGSIGSVIGGLGGLIGAAGAAAASVVALGSALASAITGFSLMKFALGGIGAALGEGGGGGGGGGISGVDQALRNLALTVERNVEAIANANNNLRDAQLGLNAAYEQGAEFLQQLGFQAEEAALSQERAGMSLEEARENLARVQDLPPNSRARREAELAFREAELNYRQAVDANSDLAKEQDKYSETGIEGTEAVIDAKERLLQAEEDLARTVRDNLRAQEQAEEALAQARRGSGGAASAQQSAYDKLTKSQKVFVDFLRKEIIPETKNLKELVAKGFLPVLETQLRRLKDGGFFEALRTGYEAVGDGLGKATEAFTDAFISNGGIDAMQEFFLQTAKVMPAVGETLGSIVSYVLSLFRAAEPLTARFTEWVTGVVGGWANSLDTAGEIRDMQDFFRQAGDMAAMFGDVFGNVFDGIGDWIDLNLAPGSGGYQIVQWLQDITDGFANIDKAWLDSYFRQSARNFIEIGDALGVVVNILTRAGGSSEVEELFENLNQGSFYLGQIGREAMKVAPEIGLLLRSVTKLIAAFADSGATKAFFAIINTMAGGFARLATEVKDIAEPVSTVFGYIAGFGQFANALSKIRDVTIGFMIPSAESVAKFQEIYKVAVAEIEGSKGSFTDIGESVKMIGTSLLDSTQGFDGLKGGISALGGASKLAFSSLIKTIGPFGLIEMGLTAVVALITLIGGLIEEEMRQRMEDATEAFERGADAVEVLNEVLDHTAFPALDTENVQRALEYATEGAKDAAVALDKYGSTIERSYEFASSYTDAQAVMNEGLADGSTYLDAYQTAMTSVGDSLAQMVTTDLGGAQDRFRNFRDELGLSNEEMIELGSITGDFREALIAEADALGINITNTQGVIDEKKLMTFAVGEAAGALSAEMEAAIDSAQAIADLAVATANTTDLTEAGWDGATFSFEKYYEALMANNQAIIDSYKNQQELIARGFGQEAIDAFTEGMDPTQAAAAIQALGEVTDAELQQLENGLLYAGEDFVAAIEIATADTATAVQRAAADAYDQGQLDMATFIGIINGEITDWTPTVKFGADTTAFDLIKTNAIMAADKAKSTVKISAVAQPKSGTISVAGIPFPFKFSGFKNGGMVGGLNMLGFADGGMVTGGFGGGRSDRIPAMLSNGEYVVNSAATAKNLSTLNAINYGGASGNNGPNVNITVNPSPGMDERELASVVSQELMRQMRRGSI